MKEGAGLRARPPCTSYRARIPSLWPVVIQDGVRKEVSFCREKWAFLSPQAPHRAHEHRRRFSRTPGITRGGGRWQGRAGSWQIRACCRWRGGQLVVEPAPTGGTALPLHTSPIRLDRLKGGERWGVGGGCRLPGSIGWRKSAPDKSWLGTDESWLGTYESWLGTDESWLGTDESYLFIGQLSFIYTFILESLKWRWHCTEWVHPGFCPKADWSTFTSSILLRMLLRASHAIGLAWLSSAWLAQILL
jgi:hypothetical protein